MTTCEVSVYECLARNVMISEETTIDEAIELLYNWLAYVLLFNLSFQDTFVVDFANFEFRVYCYSKSMFLECIYVCLQTGSFWPNDRRFYDDFYFEISFLSNTSTSIKRDVFYRSCLYKLKPLWANMVLIYCFWKKNLNAYNL